MTMTDTVEAPAAPKKKRKKAKPRTAAAPKPSSEFAGLTVSDCCKACTGDRCVISGAGYCAHPRKGGLQGRDMHDPAAIGRINDARKRLARADADKRFS